MPEGSRTSSPGALTRMPVTGLTYWIERVQRPGGRLIVWLAVSPGARLLSSSPCFPAPTPPSLITPPEVPAFQYSRFAITGRGQTTASPPPARTLRNLGRWQRKIRPGLASSARIAIGGVVPVLLQRR